MFTPYPYYHAVPADARRRTNVQCVNCGGIGHVYKTCNHPVISYGIICYKSEYDRHTNSVFPTYLMVQRKDSLCYVEFIRGKYDLQNKEYLVKLVTGMTEDERTKLVQHDFDHLWNAMWCRGGDAGGRNFNKEFQEAKNKFDVLTSGYYLVSATAAPEAPKSFVSMATLMEQTASEFNETEWGFPKGRRNINENDISCALREFHEETGIHYRNIRLCKNIKPLEEIFTGSNHIRYKHIYYVAKYVPDAYLPIAPGGGASGPPGYPTPQFFPMNKFQAKEVRDVRWFKYQAAQDKIRDTNIERKELFKRLNHLIIRNF